MITLSRPPSSRSRRVLLALLAGSLAAACGTAAPSPSATPTAPSTRSPAPATPMSSADQAAIYASMEREVEALRQLSTKRPMNPVLLDEAGLRAELQLHSEAATRPRSTRG